MGGIGHIFDDQLVDLHVDALFVFVQNDLDIVLILRMIPAERGKHRLPDFVIHIFTGNPFFLFNILDGRKKFCIHD